MENEVRLSQFQGMMHKHEFQLERSLRDVWEERRHFWRTTKQNVLLGRFKQYMASPEVLNCRIFFHLLTYLFFQFIKRKDHTETENAYLGLLPECRVTIALNGLSIRCFK